MILYARLDDGRICIGWEELPGMVAARLARWSDAHDRPCTLAASVAGGLGEAVAARARHAAGRLADGTHRPSPGLLAEIAAADRPGGGD